MHGVQFSGEGRHALKITGLEEDAENSAGEVWNQRELMEEPATQRRTAVVVVSHSKAGVNNMVNAKGAPQM